MYIVYEIAVHIMYVHLGIYLFYTIQYAMLAVLGAMLDTGVPSIVYAICSYAVVIQFFAILHAIIRTFPYHNHFCLRSCQLF
ncbi:hypothetical protein [Brevibacillus borstelensis]|uniref:hypothetical protein n=1 Tax=Brevibacillus borstelensis TaxID=45462 RepID=UPI0030C0D9EE